MDKGQKFLEIIANGDISARIENAESIEEVLQILADNGLETTAEELGILKGEEGSELDEESLEAVAGGGKASTTIKKWWKKIKKKAVKIGTTTVKIGKDVGDFYAGVWEELTNGL
jgi:hypothetical protein